MAVRLIFTLIGLVAAIGALAGCDWFLGAGRDLKFMKGFSWTKKRVFYFAIGVFVTLWAWPF